MGRIDFYRTDNPLTADPTDFKGVNANMLAVNQGEFVKRMMAEGMTEAEALRAFSITKKVFIDIHAEGKTANLGYIRTSINLTGALTKTSMPGIEVTAVVGKEVKDAAKSNSLREVYYNNNSPLILDVMDDETDIHDSVLTKGGDVLIDGRNIKVDGTDPDIGVWFTNTVSGQRHKSPKLVKNTNTAVIAKAPADLTAGVYKISVVTQCIHSNIIKDVRTGIYDVEFKVT